MLSIEQSEVFKKEHTFFKESIAKIANQELKKECNLLLDALVKEVKKLDQHHNQLGLNNRLPSFVEESRTNLASLRKLLHKKIQET